MGGGILLDLIHELDYLYWLFGKPSEGRSIQRSHSHMEIDAVDHANYNLIYKDFVANVVLNYFRPTSKRTLELVCVGRIPEANLLENVVWENGKEVFRSERRIPDSCRSQMDYLVDLIKKRKKTPSTASNRVGWC